MKILALICAAFGEKVFQANSASSVWKKLQMHSIQSPFPALTCPVQATFRTAAPVSVHGSGASGFFDRNLRKAFFWEQSSGIFDGPRFWEDFRNRGGYVGQICLQQCPGPESDMYLSPGPVHKHHGGMIQAFYSKPEGLYEKICAEIHGKFNLMTYWGPLASVKSTQWICNATCETMKDLSSGNQNALLLSYFPQLDYALQKFGPDTPQVKRDFAAFETEIEKIVSAAEKHGFQLVIMGDYEINRVRHAVYPNRILLEHGYLKDRIVGGGSYLNLHSSRAFALADHQVAHVYVFDGNVLSDVLELFRKTPGVGRVILRDECPDMNHPRCGEIILEAEENTWFSYHWWDIPGHAPDFATHVDIHNKPGFDPMELFAEWKPFPKVSLDCGKLGGSHGRACRVMLGTNFPWYKGVPTDIISVAKSIRKQLS